jgi:hypothetical protein
VSSAGGSEWLIVVPWQRKVGETNAGLGHPPAKRQRSRMTTSCQGPLTARDHRNPRSWPRLGTVRVGTLVQPQSLFSPD